MARAFLKAHRAAVKRLFVVVLLAPIAGLVVNGMAPVGGLYRGGSIP